MTVLTCKAWHDQRLETLGLLAAGVAHDVNNLLTVIENYACLVLEATAADAAPDLESWRRVRSDIEQIHRTARRGEVLAGRILAFGRPDAELSALVSVNAVVADALALLGGSFPTNIEIVASLDAECWPVRADPVRLGQAVVNLAVNARDAMAQGGTLTVRTANVEPPSGRLVRLEVVDTGNGIPAELIERVFEPFFTTRPAGSGTGLGLSMVRDYVADLGGVVRVDSSPAGSRFELLLPASAG